MTRLARAVSCAVLLLGTQAAARPPRLTLLITVDSLGSEVLLKARPRLRSGLNQLVQNGAYFPVARYEVVESVTGVGHSTIATGAWPSRHGITGNRYLNRATGKVEPVFFDATHPVLEAPVNGEDASPVTLLAETVADRLRASTQLRGKAIAIAGKGRAAVPLAGRLGEAWWFNEQVGMFVTGTWYRKEVPAWVKAVRDRRTADGYHGKSWELLGAAKDYQGQDDRPGEADVLGLGRVFPHPLSGGLPSVGPESYAALAVSPMMNDVMMEFVKAAIEAEQLGKDEVPDLLAVSFSSLDRTYHLFGPTSWEEQDHLARLDRTIGELLAVCERAAGGRANLLVVLTSDHGGAELPEVWAEQGYDARRVDTEAIARGLKEHLEKRFGAASLLAAFDGADVYLSEKAMEEKRLDAPTVRRAAAAWLTAHPDIHEAVARDDLTTTRSTLAQAFRNSAHLTRGGDVLVAIRPFAVVASPRGGTSHGSPWSYDTEVPLILYGRSIRPGVYGRRPQLIDVAPTLSLLLEQGSPAMSEGVPLLEAVIPSR